ncbi:zinc-binding domain-containing protein [Stachybotrys elegans]|uniref:Zinc-binding domain-containing protein n=1 Tax=Stachybotrys elegans TaxID=80388 RepID=A0A8K0SL11_9HYPO|nr:zinc-binding domain-containing protein [Stachybotrys elegans]
MHRKPNNRSTWSMFPSLHDQVAQLLQESNLSFAFHNVDEIHCDNEYDTNIMGRFSCHNPNCASGGWSSKVVPITIRMYSERRYNARVYHQRCILCNRLAKPRLDDSYAERVAYRLKKWSGIDVQNPFSSPHDYNKPPHISDLCEGCKAGHCRRGDVGSL